MVPKSQKRIRTQVTTQYSTFYSHDVVSQQQTSWRYINTVLLLLLLTFDQ